MEISNESERESEMNMHVRREQFTHRVDPTMLECFGAAFSRRKHFELFYPFLKLSNTIKVAKLFFYTVEDWPRTKCITEYGTAFWAYIIPSSLLLRCKVVDIVVEFFPSSFIFVVVVLLNGKVVLAVASNIFNYLVADVAGLPSLCTGIFWLHYCREYTVWVVYFNVSIRCRKFKLEFLSILIPIKTDQHV